MKKRKLLSLSLAFVVTVSSVVSLGGVPDVKAEKITSEFGLEDNVNSFADTKEEKNIEADESLKIADISDVAMEVESIDGMKFNEMERPYSGENYTIEERAGLYTESRDAAENTNPNNAYIVENDSVVQGTIGAESEMRWYVFSLSEKSKISIMLQMVETLDADLYMFALNDETYGLDLIGGSANEGAGIYEYFNCVMEAGTYFFAIGGYEGTGNFAFAYYQSTADVSYEENDSLETAALVGLSNDIEGVIDSPYDIDYFKFSISSPTIIQYSISSEKGYSLKFAGAVGDNAAVYKINFSNGSYEFMPGTYYFAVCSENGTYSESSSYTANFKKIGGVADENIVPLMAICEEACVVFQTNPSGTKYYVNGNPIDIRYEYKYSSSNSGGLQDLNITLKDNGGIRCQIWKEETQGPEVVFYQESTKPYRTVESKPLLHLLFYGNPDASFYNIACLGTKSYASDTYYDQPEYVIVLIDPDNGKLVDISEYNYFYQHIMGGNRISYYKPYTMSFGYDLRDYIN